MTGPGSPMWIVIGSGGLITGACILIYTIFRIYKYRKGYEKYLEIRRIVFAMYPLGNGLKYLLLGPAFIRWHLADFGFVGFLTTSLFWRMHLPYTHAVQYQALSPYEQEGIQVLLQRKALKLALILSLAWEGFSELLYWTGPAHHKGVAVIGRFDPIDVAAYFLAGLVCYILTKQYANGMFRWHREHPILTVAEQAEIRESERKTKLAQRAARRHHRAVSGQSKKKG